MPVVQRPSSPLHPNRLGSLWVLPPNKACPVTARSVVWVTVLSLGMREACSTSGRLQSCYLIPANCAMEVGFLELLLARFPVLRRGPFSALPHPHVLARLLPPLLSLAQALPSATCAVPRVPVPTLGAWLIFISSKIHPLCFKTDLFGGSSVPGSIDMKRNVTSHCPPSNP